MIKLTKTEKKDIALAREYVRDFRAEIKQCFSAKERSAVAFEFREYKKTLKKEYFFKLRRRAYFKGYYQKNKEKWS